MYNVFISYRKSSAVNADLIRKSIVDNSAYFLEDIFLDKHSIGPELFDDKIKSAIASSNCVVLLVTKDCFKAKEQIEEDWFLEEIRTAIYLGKKIIPVLFDKIESLSDSSIMVELNKNFNEYDIEIIVKSQSVPYSTDFHDASITKLVHFIEEANETRSVLDKTLFDLNAGNEDRLDARWHYISRDAHHQYAMEDEVERICRTTISTSRSKMQKCEKGHIYDSSIYGNQCPVFHQENKNSTNNINNRFENKSDEHTAIRHIAYADEVENVAITMASNPDVPSTITPIIDITDEVESYSSTMGFCENKRATYNATVQKSKKSIWSKLFGNKYNEVYSSIFAPAEVKRKSHLRVQVYLHLYEESEKVKSFAQESDKNAERRDYIPLSLKLKKGDKVDVEFNVYGETRLASEHKSIIWQGSFTKCSFDYFVPKDIDVEELSCEANLFVNGAMIGEMRFITQIVNVPRNLNPEILSHRFNRIFISYAHQDAQQIKLLALAYKAQGVDYFYDRESLGPGDVYKEKIFNYIDSSDLFVLCWSKNAATSDYVAIEKGRALLRAYPQLSQRDATLKICPISIEPRADLPSDMKGVYNFEVI